MWTLFFSLQPSIGGIWVYFRDLLFTELGCVEFDTIYGVLGVIWTCTFFRDILVSLLDSVVFLRKPVGVIRFFWTCNFSRDLVPGTCVLFRIWMSST